MKPETVSTLILKGGGIKGLAFAGALDVLADAGFRFDTHVGTSAGAVATVLLSAGYSSKELGQVLQESDFGKFLDAGRLMSIYNLIFRGGLYPGTRLREWVEEMLRRRPKLADETAFPKIKMEDLATGAERATRSIVFASHSVVGTITFDSMGENSDSWVVHAVRLSCSIPGFFVPGIHNGERVYDGGLLHNFPIEVYQRVRGPLPHGKDEDFIALYLGKPITGKAKPWWKAWWILEILEIMLARDDTIVLTRYQERSIVIDTAPIKTTDFCLKEVEKKFLIARGRAAAFAFLLKHVGVSSDLQQQHKLAVVEEATLLKQVNLIRRRRSLGRWALRLFATIVMGAMLWWGSSLATARLFAPSFRRDRSIKFNEHFINSADHVQALSADAIKEIRDVYADYPTELTDDCLKFDAVTQFVSHQANGKTNGVSAVKVVVLDGMAKNLSGNRLIKISSSVVNGKMTMNGFLFSLQNGQWKPLRAQFTSASGSKTAVREHVFDIERDAPGAIGFPVKLVLVTSYDEVFGIQPTGVPITAIPWILHAHRFLGQKGKATYMFLSDSPNTVAFPAHLYVKDANDAFFRLQGPSGSINSRERWGRIAPALEFLKSGTLSNELNSTQWQSVTNLVKQIAIAQTKNNQRQADGIFAFNFDRLNTFSMDASKINLLLFAERPF